jgi:CheY-like chemotaxis protein
VLQRGASTGDRERLLALLAGGPAPWTHVVLAILALFLATLWLLWERLGRGAARAQQAPSPLVYVVDDDADQAEALASFLRAREIPCRVFTDGLVALCAAAREKPAAAVLDLALPWIDGGLVCGAFKSASAQTRVLLVTALPSRLAARAAREAGADAWLEKPVDPRSLVQRLRPFLQRPRQAAGERAGLRSGT